MPSNPLHLPVIFCFAGQGSQYYGMAADVWAHDDVFRHWMERGDAIVAKRHGFSVLEEMQGGGRGPAAPFDRMEASHPAIFMVQYALAKCLQHRGIRPDLLFGVSLGEFNAQTVSGMISYETALSAVADQPAIFRDSCRPGGMIAVLGSPDLHAQRKTLTDHSELAGINSSGHFILSALAENLPAIEADLQAADVPFQRLPVPYAFHSRFIDDAEALWRQSFGRLHREPAYWPVWSSATCGLTGSASAELDWHIVRGRMNVLDTLLALERRGGGIYVDLSPSSTLTAVFRQALGKQSTSQLVPLLSPFGNNLGRIDQAVEMIAKRQPA